MSTHSPDSLNWYPLSHVGSVVGASVVAASVVGASVVVQCVQQFWSDFLKLVIFEVFGVKDFPGAYC